MLFTPNGVVKHFVLRFELLPDTGRGAFVRLMRMILRPALVYSTKLRNQASPR